MSAIRVEPVPGSYVSDWAAVLVEGPDSYAALKVLLKHSPWIVQMEPDEMVGVKFLFTTQHAGVIEQWKSTPGDWVVKSPHGKFWFMSGDEFRHEFSTESFL